MQFRLARADTPWKRFKGLMFQRSIGPDETLLLMPCNSIHSFFMRFDIDVIFLNSKMEVVKLSERLKPGRFGVICFGADAVLECPAGFIAAHNIRIRHVLQITSTEGSQDTQAASAPGTLRAHFV